MRTQTKKIQSYKFPNKSESNSDSQDSLSYIKPIPTQEEAIDDVGEIRDKESDGIIFIIIS